MNTTIRNIDKKAYRVLKAQAALEGRTVGELLNEAIRSYLVRVGPIPRNGSLRDLVPEVFPKGNERLSEHVDAIVYGA